MHPPELRLGVGVFSLVLMPVTHIIARCLSAPQQGIVPAKAAKMAAKSVTLMTEKLINIKVCVHVRLNSPLADVVIQYLVLSSLPSLLLESTRCRPHGRSTRSLLRLPRYAFSPCAGSIFPAGSR